MVDKQIDRQTEGILCSTFPGTELLYFANNFSWHVNKVICFLLGLFSDGFEWLVSAQLKMKKYLDSHV